MASQSLNSDWYTATNWLTPTAPAFSINGTGAVEFVWSVGTPPGAAGGLPISAGVYQLAAPSDSHRIYFRVTSGTATLYYQEFIGITFDGTKSGYAFSGGAGSDEDFVQSATVIAGFDDLTTRDAANPYEFAGYITTGEFNLSASADVFSAWISIEVPSVVSGRTFRIYGIKYSSDQSGNITDWDTLQNRSKTTAYAQFTTVNEGVLSVDITSIVEELQAVSGWSTTSPLQLFIEDNGSYANDLATLLALKVNSSQSAVIAVMTDGSSLEPVPAEPL